MTPPTRARAILSQTTPSLPSSSPTCLPRRRRRRLCHRSRRLLLSAPIDGANQTPVSLDPGQTVFRRELEISVPGFSSLQAAGVKFDVLLAQSDRNPGLSTRAIPASPSRTDLRLVASHVVSFSSASRFVSANWPSSTISVTGSMRLAASTVTSMIMGIHSCSRLPASSA
jgi:hypothetical protein